MRLHSANQSTICLEPSIPVIVTSLTSHPAAEETPDHMEHSEEESCQNALNDLARRGDNVNATEKNATAALAGCFTTLVRGVYVGNREETLDDLFLFLLNIIFI